MLSTAALAGFAGTAVAQDDEGAGSGQAEWAQRYDSDARQQVKKESTPTLSPATVAATEAAVTQYQAIVAQGGWGSVPNVANLHVGSKGQAVAALRHRLQVTGDLEAAAGMSPVFDAYVEAAVKRFQARHGLGQTGIVSRETVTALNIPADLRLKQLETNLIRLRSFSGDLGQRFVMANIPAASVETVENGVVFSHHVAGVGKVDRQSPVMQTKATDINFNPYWTVPASIIRKDLIPKMQADSNYLTDNHIRIFNKDNQEVASSSINWHSMDATNYKYREDPGINNSLGVVRINIGNPYGVYMHDTPTKGVFGDDFRFVSSGCIRVQNVRDYVAWLLKDNPGWDRDKIDAAIRSGERIDVKLAANIPVYWVYITAWATPDGVVQFRDDIYNRDGLGAPGTVASAADQGDDNSAVEPALQQD
ncbi:murein L,D-transpeptidase [Lichenibacterium minor]|uniref:Murein L,D-transpeptidase n=1 Tax=Lichenibacterium minor TaxID=2316528 RepID=A0A4Q2U9D8_9HYPH|nr:murein L,D-transpeptidase [Lichenibacterium minor]